MPVFSGSRYEGGSFVSLKQSDGKERKFIELRDPITIDDIGPDFRVHVVQENEHLEEISFKEYGRSDVYWIIGDVNKIDYPYDLPIGKSLIIPPNSFVARF